MIRIAVLALAGVLAGSPVKSETASSGDVRATITYGWSAAEVRVRLIVDRAGERVLDARVPPHSRETGTYPISVSFDSGRAIRVRDLDGDGDPEILLDFFSRGAHCCWWTRIYHWRATVQGYRTFARLWGNVPYRLADVDRDGRTELVSADNRFAYAFASFAGSGFPLRIWTYHGGRLVDATRAYPALVAKDAGKHWRLYRRYRAPGEVRGSLAAWAADQCLLGRCQAAFTRLRRVSHTFSGALDRQISGSAPSYLRKLRSFLRRTGYLHSR